jgi:serine/threonine protein kinase
VSALREMVLLKQVGNHPHIISMIGVVRSMPPALVLEYASRGDLCTYIRGLELALPLQAQLTVLCEIVDALVFLSQKRIVHRDVAARNCLVREDGTTCLADFGMSRLIQSKACVEVRNLYPAILQTRLSLLMQQTLDCRQRPLPHASIPLLHSYYRQASDQSVPLRWMAIETLARRKYSSKSDLWCVGSSVTRRIRALFNLGMRRACMRSLLIGVIFHLNFFDFSFPLLSTRLCMARHLGLGVF